MSTLIIQQIDWPKWYSKEYSSATVTINSKTKSKTNKK